MGGTARSPANPSSGFALCSILLSLLFAYSALVQLNDDDWYFWLPLYSVACFVCLAHAVRFGTVSRLLAYLGLVGGFILFLKVVREGCFKNRIFSWMDFLSLDMEQRLVREKLGSSLVCWALWLELEVSGGILGGKFGRSLKGLHAGMILLVSTSVCLCALYFGRSRTGFNFVQDQTG